MELEKGKYLVVKVWFQTRPFDRKNLGPGLTLSHEGLKLKHERADRYD
jgi:hypothetical protein